MGSDIVLGDQQIRGPEVSLIPSVFFFLDGLCGGGCSERRGLKGIDGKERGLHSVGKRTQEEGILQRAFSLYPSSRALDPVRPSLRGCVCVVLLAGKHLRSS